MIVFERFLISGNHERLGRHDLALFVTNRTYMYPCSQDRFHNKVRFPNAELMSLIRELGGLYLLPVISSSSNYYS